jgi:hypothetical protein
MKFLELERHLAGPGGPTKAGWRRCWIFLGAVGLVWIGASLVFRMPPIWCAMSDTLGLLDIGWRFYHHQVPNRDSSSAIGPFPEAVLGLGFLLGGGGTPRLPLALSLVGLGFAGGALALARGRLSRFWAILFAVSILAIASAPVRTGMGPPLGFRSNTSYDTLYNRLGWTVLVFAQFACLAPRRKGQDAPAAGDNRRSGLWTGFACGLAILTKINFLVGALATLLFAVWQRRKDPMVGRFCAWTALGVAGAWAWMDAWPGGVIDYFRTTFSLFLINRHEPYGDYLVQHLGANGPWTCTLFGLIAWTVLSLLDRSRPAGTRWLGNRTVTFLFVVAVGYFVALFNRSDGAQLPTLVVGALLVLETAQEGWWPPGAPTESDPDAVPRLLAVKFGVLAFMFTYLAYDAGSSVYGWVWDWQFRHQPSLVEQMPGPVLGGIPIPARFNEPRNPAQISEDIAGGKIGIYGWAPGLTSAQYSRLINDGVALLGKHLRVGDRVWALEWPSPFSLALGIPPARGGDAFWDFDRTIDERHAPSRESVMAEVSLVILRKQQLTVKYVQFLYATYVNGPGHPDDFKIVDESPLWILYRRQTRP